MGSWSTGVESSYTDVSYVAGWMNYEGEQGIPLYYFDASTGITDDDVSNFADELSLADSATILNGATATVVKTISVTTNTVYTYTP